MEVEARALRVAVQKHAAQTDRAARRKRRHKLTFMVLYSVSVLSLGTLLTFFASTGAYGSELQAVVSRFGLGKHPLLSGQADSVAGQWASAATPGVRGSRRLDSQSTVFVWNESAAKGRRLQETAETTLPPLVTLPDGGVAGPNFGESACRPSTVGGAMVTGYVFSWIFIALTPWITHCFKSDRLSDEAIFLFTFAIQFGGIILLTLSCIGLWNEGFQVQCNDGVCSDNGVCQCPQGYWGANCEDRCPDELWCESGNTNYAFSAGLPHRTGGGTCIPVGSIVATALLGVLIGSLAMSTAVMYPVMIGGSNSWAPKLCQAMVIVISILYASLLMPTLLGRRQSCEVHGSDYEYNCLKAPNTDIFQYECVCQDGYMGEYCKETCPDELECTASETVIDGVTYRSWAQGPVECNEFTRRDCSSGQYRIGNCSAGEVERCASCDPICGSCAGPSQSNCTACAAEHFVASSRNDGTVACQACTACATDQFTQVPCGVSSDAVCAQCHPACANGCHGPANDQCGSDPNAATCADGFFKNFANQCVNCTSCGAGEFESLPCSSAQDRQCAQCSTRCADPRFGVVAEDCTPTADLRCVNCQPGFLFSDTSRECVRCPMPGNCMGARNCTEGADPTAPFCSACADGFYRLLDECQPCPTLGFLPILLGSAMFLFLGFLIYAGVLRTSTMRVMRQAISHAQLLGVYFSLNVSWPEWCVEWATVMQAFVADLAVYSPECSIGSGYGLKFGLTFGVLSFLFGATWMARACCERLRDTGLEAAMQAEKAVQGLGCQERWAATRTEKLTDMVSRLSDFIVLIGLAVYIPVMRIVFEGFDCSQVDSGEWRLQSDVNIVCNKSGYPVIILFLILLALALGVLFPLYLVYRYKRAYGSGSKQDFRSDAVVVRTQRLWDAYQDSHASFACYALLHTSFSVLCLTLFRDGFSQSVPILLATASLAAAVWKTKPWKSVTFTICGYTVRDALNKLGLGSYGGQSVVLLMAVAERVLDDDGSFAANLLGGIASAVGGVSGVMLILLVIQQARGLKDSDDKLDIRTAAASDYSRKEQLAEIETSQASKIRLDAIATREALTESLTSGDPNIDPTKVAERLTEVEEVIQRQEAILDKMDTDKEFLKMDRYVAELDEKLGMLRKQVRERV